MNKRIWAALALLLAGVWASGQQVNGLGGVYINGVLQGAIGSGTVTQVGLNLATNANSIFAVGNTPISTSGNFLFGFANVSAAMSLMGPVSGANAAPTFRGIATTDLASPDAAGCLASDGAGNKSWTTCGGGGADVHLGNLSGVGVNLSLVPASDNAIDTGSTSKRFRAGYFYTMEALTNVSSTAVRIAGGPYHSILQGQTQAGDVTYTLPAAHGTGYLHDDGAGGLAWSTPSGGATPALDNLSGVAINASLIPGTATGKSLGSASYEWDQLFIGHSIEIRNNPGDAAATVYIDGDSFRFGPGGSSPLVCGIGYQASGQLGVLDGGGTAGGGILAGGLDTFVQPATDAVPGRSFLKGANAWPEAATNVTGADTILAGGIGVRKFTVVAYGNGTMAGSTVTITVNGTAYVLTEGAGHEWLAAIANQDTANSLGAAIQNNVPGLTTTQTSATVKITADATVYSLTIAKSAADAGMTATSGVDGVIQIPGFHWTVDQYQQYKWVGNGITDTWPDPSIVFAAGSVGSFGSSITLADSAARTVTIGGYGRINGASLGGVYFHDTGWGIGWEGGPSILSLSTDRVKILGNVETTDAQITTVAGAGAVGANGYIRTGLYKRSWTNAEIAALGANKSGDVKVATLPAKTVVRNAYLVIDSAATVLSDLTVAMGRTSTAYIDYTVASDAKAAANTVYGGSSGQRGTNLTGYDLPSYTAATDVYLHFVTTDGSHNLSDVLTSTGTIFLLTETLP